MADNRLEELREEITAVARSNDFTRAALIPMLRYIKEKRQGIDGEAVQLVAGILGISPAQVHAVSTFYSFIHPETQGKYVFRLCRTYSCELAGKEEIARALENELGVTFGKTSADGLFTLEWANCMGMCDQGPAMLVNDDVYTRLNPEKVRDIVERYRSREEDTAAAEKPALREVTVDADLTTSANELTFSTIPANEGLTKALAMSRVDIIDTMRDSKLKGRGGAGFPTGIKWNFAAAEKRTPKYIICNADEGEPGTFKDRLILAQYGDLVIEGMTIAARAIGAPIGLIYLRAEYSYLRPRLEEIIKKRTEAGLLGKNIGGIEGFDLTILVVMGAGAYVCGEETALIESLEGSRGEPRNRPPFPVVSGFLSRPSVVNNVETLAWVPCILAKGVHWFKSVGTDNSAGRKLFSVSGDCERPGIYEFPFGITVAELLREVGGEDAKAVQIGGASGCCVPRKDFERRLAFEDIPTGGSVMVIGPGRDMLDLAHNVMDFFVDESCGNCAPCRLGNRKLLDAVGVLRKGKFSDDYLAELRKVAETMQGTAKCGLGQASSVAFMSILEHFRDEIQPH
ncbi:MAG: iron hydrogenase [Actinobacteria bacterium]|nr:iron hydrogenase [Actinomycetota bacterium]